MSELAIDMLTFTAMTALLLIAAIFFDRKNKSEILEENKGEQEMPKIFSNMCALCGKEIRLPATDSLNLIKYKSIHQDFFTWESGWKPVCEDCASGVLNKIINEKEGDVDGS